MIIDYNAEENKIADGHVQWHFAHYAHIALRWKFTPLMGKQPIRMNWQKTDVSIEAIIEHSRNYAGANGNIGLRTGSLSGVIVIDVDKDGAETALPYPLPATVMVKTSRGRHFYYSFDGKLRNKVNWYPSIDVRGDGGVVAYPGSIHPQTNKPYTFEQTPWDSNGNQDVYLTPLPDWIVDELVGNEAPEYEVVSNIDGYVLTARNDAIKKIRVAPEGERNNRLNTEVLSISRLRAGGSLAAKDYDAFINEIRDAAISTGLSIREVEATIKSASKAGLNQPRVLREKPVQIQIGNNGIGKGPFGYDAESGGYPVRNAELKIAGWIQYPKSGLLISRNIDIAPRVLVVGVIDDELDGNPDHATIVVLGDKDFTYVIRNLAGERDIVLSDPKLIKAKSGDRVLIAGQLGRGEIIVNDLDGCFTATTNSKGEVKHTPNPGLAAERLFEIMPHQFHTDGLWWHYDGHSYVESDETTIGRYFDLMFGMKYTSNNLRINAINALRGMVDKGRSSEVWRSGMGYIPMQDGLFNIETMKLIDHTPSIMARSPLPYAYSDGEGIGCPRFTQFIETALPNEEDRMCIQEIAGYALTGKGNLRHFALFHGVPGAGKSKMAELIGMLVGGRNTAYLRWDELAGDNRFALAGLEGKRLNIADDVQGRVKDESKLKTLTGGGELLRVEKKGKDGYNMHVTAFIIATSNELSVFNDTSRALHERMLPIHFSRPIPEKDRDPDFLEHIKSELPAIFRWAVVGLRRLKAQGWRFTISESMRIQRMESRKETDPLGVWLDLAANPGGDRWASSEELYNRFIEWCGLEEINGSLISSYQKFCKRLATLGLEQTRHPTTRQRGYKGFQLDIKDAA